MLFMILPSSVMQCARATHTECASYARPGHALLLAIQLRQLQV
jgi:hypothetical protein